MARCRVHTKLPVVNFYFSEDSYKKVEDHHFTAQRRTSNFNRQFHDQASLLNLARMSYYHGQEIPFRSTEKEM